MCAVSPGRPSTNSDRTGATAHAPSQDGHGSRVGRSNVRGSPAGRSCVISPGTARLTGSPDTRRDSQRPSSSPLTSPGAALVLGVASVTSAPGWEAGAQTGSRPAAPRQRAGGLAYVGSMPTIVEVYFCRRTGAPASAAAVDTMQVTSIRDSTAERCVPQMPQGAEISCQQPASPLANS